MTGMTPLAQAGTLDPHHFMPVDEIKQGMEGYGLTVFSGTTIDTFHVEILGVLTRMVPKGDLILARLSGGPLEETGIFGGMSGSPVYINGRLIGAAAYGWLFAKDPIAGITPIGEMLDIWNLPPDSREGRRSFGFHFPPDEGQNREQGIPIPPEVLASNQISVPSSDAFLRQWRTPVAVAGFDERIVELMVPFFEQFGLTPVQGGSASGDAETPPLRPGSTVAAQFIRGDASAASVGTVTYIQGDKVLAFGHPMSRAGSIHVPMTGGIVHMVFPSLQRSFKMTTTTRPVGTFTQDRRPGTAGLLGSEAWTIPCHVDINGQGGGLVEHYSYEIVNDRLFTPTLVGWCVGNSILATERLAGLASLRIRTDIRLASQPPITLENFFTGDLAWLMATSEAIAPIALLIENAFEEIHIEEIGLTVWSEEKLRMATIEDIAINTLTIRPGDTIQMSIALRPHQEPVTFRQVELIIPNDTPDGLVKVIAADAKTARNFEKARAPFNFQPDNLNQLIDILQTRERNNEIVVMVYRATSGLTVEGEELPSPPPSLISVMSSSKRTGDIGPTKARVLSKQRLSTDYFIVGSQAMDLEVDQDAP